MGFALLGRRRPCGGPLYVPEIYENYDNNGFTAEGKLKPAYAGRMARILARADELGMVVIVGLFYIAFAKKMEDNAIWRTADESLSFLSETGRQNLLIELAHESDLIDKLANRDLFRLERAAQMINKLALHSDTICKALF